jgi:hypothetical protein
MRPYLKKKKKSHHKNRAGGVAQGIGPEFKPQNHPKKTKKTTPYPSPWLPMATVFEAVFSEPDVGLLEDRDHIFC